MSASIAATFAACARIAASSTGVARIVSRSARFSSTSCLIFGPLDGRYWRRIPWICSFCCAVTPSSASAAAMPAAHLVNLEIFIFTKQDAGGGGKVTNRVCVPAKRGRGFVLVSFLFLFLILFLFLFLFPIRPP